MADCHIFLTLDLVKAYDQIRLVPKDIPKVATSRIVPVHYDDFLTVKCGVNFWNIHSAVWNLHICVNLDAVLVALSSDFLRLEHLEFIFQYFLEAGLVVRVEKCNSLQ